MSARVRRLGLALGLFGVLACGPPAPAPRVTPGSTSDSATRPTATDRAIARLRGDAQSLEPLAESALAKDFLKKAPLLPSVSTRTLHHDAGGARYYTAAEFAKLPPAERVGLEEETGASDLFYETHYGSPLAYVRPIDVVGRAGLATVAGKRVVDFGYGTVGHLRLLASLGADAVGVDVDPFLVALYSEPSDRGPFPIGNGMSGRVNLVSGRFPADKSAAAQVGAGYTLFLAKNTLKNGYLHPAEPVPPKQAFELGVTDEAFVAAVRDVLTPGGYFLIYNVSPKPAGQGEKYKPWADGRCPFPRASLETAGFEVLAFDQDDSAAMRAIGKALRWDVEMKMNLATDMFALYTLARRR